LRAALHALRHDHSHPEFPQGVLVAPVAEAARQLLPEAPERGRPLARRPWEELRRLGAPRTRRNHDQRRSSRSSHCSFSLGRCHTVSAMVYKAHAVHLLHRRTAT